MMAKSRPYETSLYEALQDPVEAAEYLSAAMEEDPAVFLLALKHVTEARGGMSKIARQANLNRESLYRALSENGNPKLKSLDSMLHAMGLKLSVSVDDMPERRA